MGAASEASEAAFSIVPWIPLLVAFVVAATTIGTSWWNTRGESSALRRLKAMNEAVEGIPAGRAARDSLEQARDRLAQRIAESDAKPSFWRTNGQWIGLGVILIGTLALGLFLNAQDQGQGAGDSDLVVFLSSLAATVTALLGIAAAAMTRRVMRRLDD